MTSVSAPVSMSLPRRAGTALSNEVLGTIIFVTMEVMFFMALISAYVISHASLGANWLPPAGIRLPIWQTGINTGILLASGVAMALASRGTSSATTKKLSISCGLAAAFLLLQGREWLDLLSHGMTMTSNVFAAVFFLVIGAHALHVAGGIIALTFAIRSQLRGTLTLSQLHAMQLFWYFLVGIWPLLYYVVYFGH